MELEMFGPVSWFQSHWGGGGQRNGARVQLCQISTGRMRGVDERYYHWIGDSCPGLH